MSSSFQRPLIGISCGSIRRPPGQLSRYSESIRRAGGDAVCLPYDTAVEFDLAKFDALLIPGGADIQPALYGEAQKCDINPESDARVRCDLDLLSLFLKYNKPVLGICYGMQLINVFMGGTLYQDILTENPAAYDHRSGLHEVTIKANRHVADGLHMVNSSHHQAVRNMGRGLIPLAFSADGILEAFCGSGSRFLMGVQWHPERMTDAFSKLLFSAFVRSAQVS